jgi:hypothetical protein
LCKVTEMVVHAASFLLRPGAEARRHTNGRLLFFTRI